MKAKIIPFPKEKIVRNVVLSDSDRKRLEDKSKKEFANFVMQELINELLTSFDDFDFDTTSPNFVKDFSYSMDALKATIYRSLELDHPLHELIDEKVNIVFEEKNDEREREQEREEL